MNKSCLVILLLLLFSSCTSDIDQMVNGLLRNDPVRKSVFHASTELPSTSGTKVYADEDMKVLWNADDRISIFNLTTYNYQFAFTGDDGDTAGGFELIPDSGFITGQTVDYVYAAYPYSKTNKLSNQGIFTMVLPAEQSYKEHSFGIGANTMVAVTEDNFLAFKNVGGYLSLRLYGDDVKVSRITIKGNNGEKLAGKASIEMPLGGVPTVTMDNSATDEISVVCNPAVKIGADANSYTDFWFVIPPVYFSLGFTITVTDDKGGVFERTTSKALTINRNTLEWMAALKVVPDYTNANVQFEDANFKAYCVENFDKDGNGEISMAEANDVTEINVNTEIVASLKGIEYFKNLQSLTCRLNYRSTRTINGERHYYNANKEEIFSLLTTLDLSHNSALTSLNCSSNQLTSLDVSNNTALTYLNCYSNQLTSLDVSNNTALISLNCSSNQLTSLDVSNNLALTNLHCYSNQLMSLDVSYNTELTDLSCGSNQLTSLDVSYNTALQSLYCGSNQLTSLDVSYNTELTDLSCGSNQLTSLDVSYNTALQSLSCYSNQLTSLDVSHNTELQSLYCSSNQLTSLDVSQNTALTNLDCSSNQLTSLDVSHNTALTSLYCDSNQLTSLDVSQNLVLNELYCSNSTMEFLYLSSGQEIVNLEKHNNTRIVYCPTAFPDVNFRDYVFRNFDTDRNGVMSENEYNAVTAIEVNTDNITTLSGIEHFVNLQVLKCSGTTGGLLTSLDLSNNHSLSELDCSNNQLASLSLWVYGWTLTKFDCSQNRLTSLEFPDGYGYPIQELNCGGNEITTLNLANLSSLRTLNCKALPLRAIEVPRYVTTLTAEAFQGCSQLTEVIVPAAVTEIGDRAFADCPLLTAVKMHKETPPALGSQAFEGSPDCLIYVVSSSIAAYQAAEGWSDYYDRFRAFSQTGSHEGIGYDIWE